MTQSPCIHGQYDRERGKVPGSYGHYTQDAQTFASWGVDSVGIDYCYGNSDTYGNVQAAHQRS